jgi:hypothetical protein
MAQGLETINEIGTFFDVYRETFLPDLYLFFTKTPGIKDGARTFVTFLRVFEGATITIPSADALDNLRRDVEIYRTLTAAPGERARIAATRNLAAAYEITATEIRRIFGEMKERAQRSKGAAR